MKLNEYLQKFGLLYTCDLFSHIIVIYIALYIDNEVPIQWIEDCLSNLKKEQWMGNHHSVGGI